ncbi:hypothetical protein Q9L58_009496 [Maublancomyces gigas]|uniref:Uncharacterized protein n=1 Tax=Discina gigas TaxID=1032678 RepID=A0ABR3G6T6_9PEZI
MATANNKTRRNKARDTRIRTTILSSLLELFPLLTRILLTLLQISALFPKMTGHLLGNLRARNNIQLGRLVLNAKEPHQDYVDPFGIQNSHPDFSTNSQTNFLETQKFSKSSRLRPYLGTDFCISYERQDTSFATLTAPLATTHDLNNSGAWFLKACAAIEARKFLENAMNNRSNVYLVVGFRTVHSGSLVKGSTWIKGQTMDGGVPIRLLTGGISVSAIGMGAAAPSVKATVDARRDRERMFTAPGEYVFAILYRKIKFKRLSSRHIKNMYLEPANRWKTWWDWRGLDDEEDNDEDDVMEAYLTDESDLEISDEEDSSGDETDSPQPKPSSLIDIHPSSKRVQETLEITLTQIHDGTDYARVMPPSVANTDKGSEAGEIPEMNLTPENSPENSPTIQAESLFFGESLPSPAEIDKGSDNAYTTPKTAITPVISVDIETTAELKASQPHSKPPTLQLRAMQVVSSGS